MKKFATLLLAAVVAVSFSGLAMAGKVSVNLNYTATPESVEECAQRAKVGGIVTSARFLEKLGWERTGRMILIRSWDTSGMKMS